MTAVTEMVDLETRDDVALLIVDNPPVNALSRGVRDGLYEGVRQIAANPAVKAAVLWCRGRTFIAGADIREFGKPMQGTNLLLVEDTIEGCSKPIVAAIHGTALGGGLETAMSCHYRVAVASAQVGLPEVKLGILPGARGTQLLPRIVGVEKALEMMTSGEPIGAQAAYAAGLLDAIIDGDLVEGALGYARGLIAEGRGPVRIRDRNDKLAQARGKPELFQAIRKSIAKKKRGFEAPESIVQCVEAAVERTFEEGLKVERDLFVKLMTGLQSQAQRYYFFAERQASKIPDVPADTPERKIAKVGILGAGTMGGGIAMNFANTGIPVTIVEVAQEALDRGLGVVRKNYERSVKGGRITQDDVDKRMGLIRGSLKREDFADCDLVIEAVFENMDLKKEIFGALDKIAKKGAILASNTSALDINEIASATGRPGDVIGLHFFSPANVMKLLEVVRGAKTDKDAIATAMTLARKIGKIPVLVGVCRGFVGNRMLYARRVQAEKLILEGALPWDVDRVIYDFGFPMGPYAMSDLAGLDIGWNAKASKGETIRDRLCEMGRRGQKTGAGYYNYDPETREAKPEPKVAELIEAYSKEKGITRRKVSDDEILARCIYPMINEGAKILEEKIAIRPSDIDVVWVNGYGWPVYRGGPMFYADSVGLPKVVETMEAYRAQDKDEFWKPAPLLAKLAAEGKGFKDL
jgi:3-hydroxyacyl-CoA dehydrogenase